MERFGWTEKEFYTECTFDFYNEVMAESDLRAQAEKMKAQMENVKGTGRR